MLGGYDLAEGARRLLFFCIFVRCLSNSTQRVYEDRQSLIAQYWESSVRFACVPIVIG